MKKAKDLPGLPLDGVKVVDFGQYIAGPGAAMVLCELGADVVKVEPIDGDMARHIGRYGEAMIRAYNRSKRSIAVDLRREEGLAAVTRLIRSADVVIQNLRPGVMDKLGLGADTVRSLNPAVVYLSITGFGPDGPSRNRPGYDIAAQAESGLMSVTGMPDGLPQKVGVPIIDTATAHIGAQAVLAALFRRERTGVGEAVEVSLLDVALHLQLPTWSDFLHTGIEPKRVGDGQPSNAPAADLVKMRDGYIVISAYADDHWVRFCKVVGRDDLAVDPRFSSNALRVRNRPALREALHECLSHFDSEECVALLGRNQIVAGVVRSYSQALASADIQNSRLLVDVPGCDGQSYQSFGLPYRMWSTTRRPTMAAPGVGADTDGVLAEAGYNKDEIEALRASGVVV